MSKTEIMFKQDHKKIVDAAGQLFSVHGVRAVSLAMISDLSRVSTTTMYRHFGSKDDLIKEYVGIIGDDILHDFDHASIGETDSLARLEKSLFAILPQNAADRLRKCRLGNFLAEFILVEHAAKDVALRVRSDIGGRIVELLSEVWDTPQRGLAESLMTLIDGSWMSGATLSGAAVEQHAHALRAEVGFLLRLRPRTYDEIAITVTDIVMDAA